MTIFEARDSNGVISDEASLYYLCRISILSNLTTEDLDAMNFIFKYDAKALAHITKPEDYKGNKYCGYVLEKHENYGKISLHILDINKDPAISKALQILLERREK